MFLRLEPWHAKGNVVKLPHEFLGFLDLEGAAVGSAGCPEEVDGCGDELCGHAECYAVQVKDKPHY